MQNLQIEGNLIGLKVNELSGIKSVSAEETKPTITKLQTLAEAKKIDVEENEQNYISTGINSYNTLKDAKINKNFFYSNSDNVDKHGVGQDHAIYLRGSQNIDFVGNHVRGFHNGPAGGIKFKSGRNILIMNNYFRNTGIIMYGNTEYGLGDTYT
ncbi:cell surface protein, partial [Listeria booriae]|nr:cell surface protein [Listeria booriae]